jgi:hypothetical protein
VIATRDHANLPYVPYIDHHQKHTFSATATPSYSPCSESLTPLVVGREDFWNYSPLWSCIRRGWSSSRDWQRSTWRLVFHPSLAMLCTVISAIGYDPSLPMPSTTILYVLAHKIFYWVISRENANELTLYKELKSYSFLWFMCLLTRFFIYTSMYVGIIYFYLF